MKNTFWNEFLQSAKEAPRIYFAPLLGAIAAIRAEFRLVRDGQPPSRDGR